MNDFEICPFNRAHIVRKDRIQYHITKCKKSYKGCKVPCPFNASEYIEPNEMDAHLVDCVNRKLQECRAFDSRSSVSIVQAVQAPFFHVGLPEVDENWGIDNPAVGD